ncbi:MAG: PKD domain-containing protein, partial [Thermoplasmatota archaeon]
GDPIAGATVIIIKLDGSEYNYTSSNETGYYLINVTFFGIHRIAIQKDSFIEYTNYIYLDNETNAKLDFTLRPIPAETEAVGGTVTFDGGASAVGVEVTLLYEDEGNRHEYKDVTDALGDYGFTVFPAAYKLEVKLDGLNVYEEEVAIDSGGGPYDFDVTLPSLPPKDAKVTGYVMEGEVPLPGAMVGIMDPVTEIVNMTFTNETGYYELGFWEGQHYLISMAEGYDSYFRGIQLSSEDELQINIYLKKEEFQIKGWVLDPAGLPVNDVRVQFIKPYTFPDDNSATTNEMGYFEFDVSGGTGYLMVVEDNPFEAGEYDVYFDKIEDLRDNLSVNINLTQNDYTTGEGLITFDGWSSFSSSSRMALPVNNTMASRAYVDMMMGNGDLTIDQDEFDLWTEAMIGDDSEIADGPFGKVSDDNITIDGLSYHINESSHKLDFRNFTGPIDSTSRLELQQSSNYSLADDLPDTRSHVVRFNGTFSREREMMTMHAYTPMGWIITDISDTVHEITHSEGMLEMSSARDPDDEDDIDYEWISLTYHDNTFDAEVIKPEEPVEGEPFNISVNVTEYLPDNSIHFTYDFGDDTTLDTNDTEVTHTYADNGSYDVEITIWDNYTREITEEFTLEVGNLDPIGTFEVEGGLNRTFEEGDTVTFILNASDVPADPLTVAWRINDEEAEVLTYDELNRTREIKLTDDGSYMVTVIVDDGDGGELDLNVTFDAVNLDPVVETDMVIAGGKENVIQGDHVTINITSMSDPSVEDVLTINWTIPDQGCAYQLSDDEMTLDLDFFEIGTYNITLIVSDDDGGEFKAVFPITVGANNSYDRDGDGIPGWWEEQYGMSDEDPSDAGLDNDGDNLTNLEEYIMDTDPTDEDTDNDGVPDDYDADPKDPTVLGFDTDGDGYSDWEELKEGTDPDDADDHPGKKDDDGNNIIVWIILLAIALIAIMIIVVYMFASNKERGLYSEE